MLFIICKLLNFKFLNLQIQFISPITIALDEPRPVFVGTVVYVQRVTFFKIEGF